MAPAAPTDGLTGVLQAARTTAPQLHPDDQLRRTDLRNLLRPRDGLHPTRSLPRAITVPAETTAGPNRDLYPQ